MPNHLERAVEQQLHNLQEVCNNPVIGASMAAGACLGAAVGGMAAGPDGVIGTFFTSLAGSAIGAVLACQYGKPIAMPLASIAVSTAFSSLAGNLEFGSEVAKAGALGAVFAYAAISSCRPTSAERLVNQRGEELTV